MIMKTFVIAVLTCFSPFTSITNTQAHVYDSVGVEAGPHVHDNEKSDAQMKDNCFIDEKFGPVCK